MLKMPMQYLKRDLFIKREGMDGNSLDLFQKTASALNKSNHIANREKDILENLQNIEVYKPCDYLTVAEFYSKDNGFQMVIDSTNPFHKPGDITN